MHVLLLPAPEIDVSDDTACAPRHTRARNPGRLCVENMVGKVRAVAVLRAWLLRFVSGTAKTRHHQASASRACYPHLTGRNTVFLHWPLGSPMPSLPAHAPRSNIVAPGALRAVPLLPVTFRSFTARAAQWLPR